MQSSQLTAVLCPQDLCATSPWLKESFFFGCFNQEEQDHYVQKSPKGVPWNPYQGCLITPSTTECWLIRMETTVKPGHLAKTAVAPGLLLKGVLIRQQCTTELGFTARRTWFTQEYCHLAAVSQNFLVKGINRELRPNTISLIQWDWVRISCIVCFIHEDQWLSTTRIIFCQTGCCDGVDGPYISLGEPSACPVCSPLAHPFLL